MSNDFEPGDLKDDWYFSPFFLWLENLYWENPPQLFDAFCRHSGYREKNTSIVFQQVGAVAKNS